MPITAPVSSYSIEDIVVPHYSERNMNTIPNYHRLDLAYTYKRNAVKRKKYQDNFTFSFIDIYIDTPLQNSSGESSYVRWTVDEVYSFTDDSCGPFDFAQTCYFNDPADESEVLLFQNEGGTQITCNQTDIISRISRSKTMSDINVEMIFRNWFFK